MPKTLVHTINDFNVGMTPNIYGEGISRMEHFDTITGQARPYRALVASTMNNSTRYITNFTRGYCKDGAGNGLWALGQILDSGTNYYPCLLYWNSSKEWSALKNFGASYAPVAQIIHYYNGAIYGLQGGTNIWKIVPGTNSGATSFAATHAALTYTEYCRPITHSKDGKMYFGTYDGTNGIITRFDGTTPSTGLTLPVGFLITSISESGDFIEIVGYDIKTGQSTAYLWDRDSSLETTTQKYDLNLDTPLFTANLGGTQFIVTTTKVTINPVATPTAYYLNIKYIYSDKPKMVNQFRFYFLLIDNRCSYVFNDKIYFSAIIKFKSSDSYHFVVFELDSNGSLKIAQNLSVFDALDTNYIPTDVIIDGEGFWVAGSANGQFHSASGYPSVTAQSSFFETVKYSSPDFANSIDIVGYSVTFEPLPANSSVVVKTRADAETAWTTIATFDTDDAVSGEMNSLGTNTCAERQFRIESLGGAVVTGWQAKFSEVPNSVYA